MRNKVWRSNKDKELHLICAEGADAFEALPIAIRNLGPWTGSKEGEVDRLRLPHRTMLTEQGFTIVYSHISKLNLEVPTGPPIHEPIICRRALTTILQHRGQDGVHWHCLQDPR